VIVAIEGIDGAGKNTLARRLAADLRQRGRSVATLSFPRYDAPPLGTVIRRMLAGDPAFADTAASPHTAALLFALDRAGAATMINSLASDHDVVLVDRYIASNAAYGAARAAPARRDELAEWVAAVEVGDLGVPVPDLQILVQVPVATAASRAARRSGTDDGRGLDVYEQDLELQDRCASRYAQLAAANWLSDWFVLDEQARPPAGGSYDQLVRRLLDRA
jgi:dTMP kinase